MSEKKAVITFAGDDIFEAQTPTGNAVRLDFNRERNSGASPVELLLIAVGGCTAIDVITILEKKRQKVNAYRVEVEGERADENPRYVKKFIVRHIFHGENLDEKAVRHAVELSDEKYCSVGATVKPKAQIVSEIEIHES